MEELRLPWNNRDGILYGGVIAAITCIIMITFNLCKVRGGVEPGYIVDSLVCLPFVWVAVMLIMTFFVGRASDFIVRRMSAPTDGFNARILFNIIACVTMMSVIMTAVGPIIGSIISGNPSIDEIWSWPANWPVNFCVAFWTETLVAQPAARTLMKRMHIRRIASQRNGGVVDE